MNRIRWEEDFGDPGEYCWLGYLGRAEIAVIEVFNVCILNLLGHEKEYSKLSSAKRGAERMLDKFLRESGLEVKV